MILYCLAIAPYHRAATEAGAAAWHELLREQNFAEVHAVVCSLAITQHYPPTIADVFTELRMMRHLQAEKEQDLIEANMVLDEGSWDGPRRRLQAVKDKEVGA